MELLKKLEKIGLSTGESKIYLALLRCGSVPVRKLKEETNLHRTTIYDFLEKLLNKGLITFVKRGKINYYNATNPEKLIDMLAEKQSVVNEILPLLKQCSLEQEHEISVEVFKGKEGIKTILNDILRTGKDYVILGVDERMFQEKLGSFMDTFFRKEKEKGFKERILTSNEVTFTYPYETAFYRYLPKESFNPTPTYIWANNVGIVIWEPLSVIKIKSAALADSYSKYYEILWNTAQKKPKSAL